MTEHFSSARLKIERANQHANALKASIQRWLEDRPYELALDFDAQAGEYSLVIHVTRKIPPEWSVVAGEVIHNLRSALDHIIYDLGPVERSEFPIFIDEDKFLNKGRGGGLFQIRGVTNESARAFIKQLQPFRARKAGLDPTLHRFWILNELSNADKHRLLNPLGVITGAGRFRLNPGGQLTLAPVEVRADGPVEDGAVLARWRIRLPPGGKGHVTVEGDITYDVAFDEAGPARGGPVSEVLDDLGNFVFATRDYFIKLL
jgi:hypothetical protein